MTLDPGTLDRRVTILAAQPDDDGFSSNPGEHTEVGKRWMSRKDVSDSERIRAESFGAAITSRFVCHYDSLTATIRPAIALMERGRQGILDVQNEILRGDVSSKIDKRLEGEAAATQRVANAFESLKIAIGEAGLTALITSIKNAWASLLETIAGANPAFLQVGVAVGALVAALGPLVAIAGVIAKVVLVRLAQGFGVIGRAIAFIIAPAEALVATLIEFGAARALTAGLGMVARAFLGLTGPVGWAIGAFLLFKDSISAALQRVWEVASQVLGPPLAALFAQVGAVVGNVVNGPIGSA